MIKEKIVTFVIMFRIFTILSIPSNPFPTGLNIKQRRHGESFDFTVSL